MRSGFWQNQIGARQQRNDGTIDKVLTFEPDRVALHGYAHMPWVSRRQKLIDEDALPDDMTRYTLTALAAEKFTGAEMTPIRSP
ncbi:MULTISPECIES: hypothetical protein [unclassified Ruegeria]|uniref:hypothetical protein n=1 Tax=unclassified Ruegeria TaxID=2625375 RepID=UPI0014894AA4|nr:MULTISPECIES: hypothetical protein [unclassified Ruegeria]